MRLVKVVPVITGLGLVTPLGRSVERTWSALLDGQTITDHARLEIDATPDVPRVASLGMEAADQAIANAHWDASANDAAVICCTSKGSIESWTDEKQSAVNHDPVYGLADLSTAIARHTRLGSGPRLTLSAACAGGLHGLIRAAMMIRSGQVSRVLVVAAEASVNPLFLSSFRRLGVLPPQGQLCRPFDQNRGGFLMSEAAAAVCVESSVLVTDAACSIAVDRFAMGGDAAHLTGSDPDRIVLRRLLQQTIGQDRIDLIHAHGTGTVSNDQTELSAIEAILPGESSVAIYSHKAALGHSLGASGLVAVVINCLCHQAGVIPPNCNTVFPLPMSKVHVRRAMEKRSMDRSLVHAAGFGGPTAVVGLNRFIKS